MKNKSGFTIVELLIVIVVIAILAAITIVAYNGIQQRSTNSSISSAANQARKEIQAYVAANDAYPQQTGPTCLIPSSGTTACQYNGASYGVDATLVTNLSKLATVPSSLPQTNSLYGGVLYRYSTSRTFNGDQQPAMLEYYLVGSGQKCPVTPINTQTNDTTNNVTICGTPIIGPAQ